MVSELVFILFMLGGGTYALVGAYREYQKLAATRADVKSTKGGAPTVSGNGTGVVTGIVGNNLPLSHPVYSITAYDLVAYKIERWKISRDERLGLIGDWFLLAEEIPTLTVQVGAEPIQVMGKHRLSLEGKLHEFVQRPDDEANASKAEYKNLMLGEGALRISGLQNGDRVTVVGTYDADQQLVPTRIFAGDQAVLATHLRNTLLRSVVLFGFQLVVGGYLMLFGLAHLFRSIWRIVGW